MPAVQLVQGVWWVGGGSWGDRVPALSVNGCGNIFLVGGDGDFLLVDAGVEPGVDILLENCASVGAEPSMISRIVLTHPHDDHVLGTPLLQRKTGALVAGMDPASTSLASDPRAHAVLGLEPGGSYPFPLDESLSSGDTLAAGPFSLDVLSVPGHIPASLALSSVIDGVPLLFTGDAAIGDQGDALGVVGWLDGHWHSNPRHLLRSIRAMQSLAPSILLPGHGAPVSGRQEVDASLEHCAERLLRLLDIPYLNTMMPLDLSD